MRQQVYAIFLAPLICIHAAKAQQAYPNIEGETLMEDDRVVVQRFVLQPGEWEGIHAHPEHQLVIVLNSSDELTYKYGDKETVFAYEEGQPEKMSVFWRPPVDISEQHESGNTGTKPLEWIAITFKSDSIASEDTPTTILNRELNK